MTTEQDTIQQLNFRLTALEQAFRRHNHDGIETDTLTIPSPPAAVSDWSLVSYTYATGINAVITGLDLGTDLLYHIIIDFKVTSSSGILYFRCNNDNTGGRHKWASQGYMLSVGRADTGGAADNKWEMNHNGGNRCHHVDMMLAQNSNVVLSNWNTASVGTAGDGTSTPTITNGCGYWDHSSNITSFSVTNNSGVSGTWNIWVYKSSQS